MSGDKKKMMRWTGFTIIGIIIAANIALFAALSGADWAPNFFRPAANASVNSSTTGLYEVVIIDSSTAGDCKMAGDIDGDGFPDLVMGGMPQEKLNWYRYPGWEKTEIAVPSTEFTTDGALGDVDGDGDLDIIVPDGSSGDNLLWFENPIPTADPGDGAAWALHTIGAIGSWGKDVEPADFDGNGLLDIAARSENEAMIFFQAAPDVWNKVAFSGVDTGNEGMAGGDVDGDGDADLVLRGVWLQNPGGQDAVFSEAWSQHHIGEVDQDFKALIVDLDQNGVIDILFSSSEGTAPVDWWTPASGSPTGSWTKHNILPVLEKAHTLQVADMDRDGDLDVVVGQMHTSSAGEILVMTNKNGQATEWEQQVVGDGGLHNGVVVDIGSDGDYDIFGSNWTGNPPVRLWESRVGEMPQWAYKEVTTRHEQTFALAFGDLDGDERLDIISGRYWYRNPGADLMGSWVQSPFPPEMQAALVVDVDGDLMPDIIAQKAEQNLSFYWLEAADSTAQNWTAIMIGEVEHASHTLGAQGYRAGQLETGGKDELVFSSGNGIYYFRVPENPAAGNWPRVHVNSNPSDEGFAFGDIDGDGDLDIAATTGDSKRVEWYRNPGDGSGEWEAFPIAEFSDAVYPDRTEIADLNGDGRPDIIVSEENGEDKDAQTYWWEQPVNLEVGSWEKHLIASQATTNSLDAADIDQDNDIDIILAEHRGDKKLVVLINDGSGRFSEMLISEGKESHLGAQTIDLDRDGDLDIVSIAWDDFPLIHLWRNDSNGAAPPTPQPTPVNAPTSTPGSSGRGPGGPLVLYTFEAGNGSIIADLSGIAEPVDLHIEDPSAVTWLPEGGLSVDSPTILQSSGHAEKIIKAIQTSNAISVEAWIKPDSPSQNGPARIVTLSLDTLLRNFTLGQEGSAYDFRLRTTGTSEGGTPSTSTEAGLLKPEITHLVYTRDSNGQVEIYMNGKEVANGAAAGDFSSWDSSQPFALANELTMDRPWLGEYYLVAVFDRALSASEVNQKFLAGHILSADEAKYLPFISKDPPNDTHSVSPLSPNLPQPAQDDENRAAEAPVAESSLEREAFQMPIAVKLGFGILLVVIAGGIVGVFRKVTRRHSKAS